jgi:predicted lipid-binding transport protein (Tim44 family)
MSAWIAGHNVYEATFYDVGQSTVTPSVDPNSFAAVVADFGHASTSTVPTPPAAPTAPPATTPTAPKSTPTAAGTLPATSIPPATVTTPAAAEKAFLAAWKAHYLRMLWLLKLSSHHLSSIHFRF